MSRRRNLLDGLVLALALVSGVLATGCGKFFPPLTPNCTAADNCTTTTDFMYVANSSDTAASPASIAGFSLTTTTTPASGTTPASSSLTLAKTPNSAYSLGFVPTAMAISSAHSTLYVASKTGGIYLYTINSDGSITLQNNSQPVASSTLVASMKIDATGAWLITASLTTTSPLMTVYSIASTTGLLGSPGTLQLTKAGIPNQLVIAPANTTAYLTFGTGGIEAFTFNPTTGVLGDAGNIAPLASVNADTGAAVDPGSSYLFVAETGASAVRVFSISTSPALSEVSGSPFATGLGPSAVLVDSSGSYVYVTNQTDDTISGFVLAANGTLTAISGSPFATGSAPVDIVEDASKSYVGVVCNGGNQDLEIYSFDATTGGKLDADKNATTGTDPSLPIAIVATSSQ